MKVNNLSMLYYSKMNLVNDPINIYEKRFYKCCNSLLNLLGKLLAGFIKFLYLRIKEFVYIIKKLTNYFT